MILLYWCGQHEQHKSNKYKIKTLDKIIKSIIKPKTILIISNPLDTEEKIIIKYNIINTTNKSEKYKLLQKYKNYNYKQINIECYKCSDENFKSTIKQHPKHLYYLTKTNPKGKLLQDYASYHYLVIIKVNSRLTNHKKFNNSTDLFKPTSVNNLIFLEFSLKINNIMTTISNNNNSNITTPMALAITSPSYDLVGATNTTTIATTAHTLTPLRLNQTLTTNVNILKTNHSFSSSSPSNINNDTYNDDLNDFTGDSEVLQTIEYMSTILSFYYIPIIVGTGSIGNILSVFVFFKTKLRKLSSSFYLAALAVSDTCFLLGLFAQWLNFFDIRIYNREYFCQFFTFFSNLACFCSVWFVVAFTVERFIAVMYPLKRQTMCTVRRAKMVLVGLTILGCLHCIPFWISSTAVYSPKVGDTICDIKREYKVSKCVRINTLF